MFGFDAQQAVEKALKTWLTLLNIEYPKAHDLSLLLALLQAEGQVVNPFMDIVELNPYAVQYRYEAFDEIDDPLDRSEMVNKVRTLMETVGSLLTTEN